MTSFHESDLQTYADHQHLIKFAECIPIAKPGETLVEGIQQLSLCSGSLKFKSYVRLQHMWQVPISSLWKYYWQIGSHAYTERLSEQSYKILMEKFGIQADVYESVETMVCNADWRLRRLAENERPSVNEHSGNETGVGNSNEGSTVFVRTGYPTATHSFEPLPSTYDQPWNQTNNHREGENHQSTIAFSSSSALPSFTYPVATYQSPPPVATGTGQALLFNQSFPSAPNTNTTNFTPTFQTRPNLPPSNFQTYPTTFNQQPHQNYHPTAEPSFQQFTATASAPYPQPPPVATYQSITYNNYFINPPPITALSYANYAHQSYPPPILPNLPTPDYKHEAPRYDPLQQTPVVHSYPYNQQTYNQQPHPPPPTATNPPFIYPSSYKTPPLTYPPNPHQQPPPTTNPYQTVNNHYPNYIPNPNAYHDPRESNFRP
jgi:hypothetical protein